MSTRRNAQVPFVFTSSRYAVLLSENTPALTPEQLEYHARAAVYQRMPARRDVVRDMQSQHEHISDPPPSYIRFSPTVALLRSPPSPAASILPCSREKEPSFVEKTPASRCAKDTEMHTGYQAATLSGFAELVHLVVSNISATPPSTPSEEIPTAALFRTARFGIAELTLSLMYPDLTLFSQSPPVHTPTPSQKRASNLTDKEHERVDNINRWNVHVHSSLGRYPSSPLLP